MPRPLRIAQFLSHSGINGVVTSVLPLLPELVGLGHAVMLVHRPGAWIADALAGSGVSLAASPLRSTREAIADLKTRLRDFGADVIHTHGGSAHKLGAILRMTTDMPVVATAHSRHIEFYWAFNNRIIAPSPATAAFHRRWSLVRGRNIRIIPNLFRTDAVPLVTPAQRAAQRAALGIPEGAFVLGTVGEVNERKHQIDAVRVLDLLVRDGLDARLVLVGAQKADRHRERMEALIAARGLAPRVLRLGERSDARALIAAFDVFVFTSRNETAPVACAEAMAAGLPLLATPVGDLPLHLSDGTAGRLFPIGAVDAMARFAAELAADPDARERMGAAGRRLVAERLSPAHIAPRIEAVYRELVPEGGNAQNSG